MYLNFEKSLYFLCLNIISFKMENKLNSEVYSRFSIWWVNEMQFISFFFSKVWMPVVYLWCFMGQNIPDSVLNELKMVI